MTNVTHWKKLTNPRFLGSQDFQPGEELTITIENISTEIVKSFDGKVVKDEMCIVAYLKDQKPWILNKTNCKTIAGNFATNYVEKWIGKSITLYVAPVKAFGELTEAIRVRSKKELDKSIIPVESIVPTSSTKDKLLWLNAGTREFTEALAGIKEKKTTLDELKTKYKISKATESKLLTESK